MPEIAYVNGEFMPLEQAVVHIEDRGFQFADSVYEVIRTYGGRPFAVEQHLARLEWSANEIELRPPCSRQRLTELIEEAVRRAQFPESVIYLQITRGRARRHRGFPAQIEPTLVLTVREGHAPPSQVPQDGVAVITVPDNRWGRCDIKSVALLANVLAYRAAQKAGAHDAIFTGLDGTISEATAGNVFIVHAGELRTPPRGRNVLSGVTRDHILQAAKAIGVSCRETPVTREELTGADEVFLTSTNIEAMPVGSVDGHKIGNGKAGPLTERVYGQFLKMFTNMSRVS